MKWLNDRGGSGSQLGYTIVEAMIFLAVSGGLLLAASTIISGRQERVRFTQGVEGLQLRLQDTFNDVATGYFPSNSDIACTSGSVETIDINSSPKNQGSNQGCVFAGKYIAFDPTSSSYRAYTIAKSSMARDFKDGAARLLGYEEGNNAGIAEEFLMQADLLVRKNTGASVQSGVVNTESGRSYDGLIVASVYTNADGESVKQSNASRVKLYGFRGEVTNEGFLQGFNAIPESLDEISTAVVLCLDQVNGRKASLRISKQLSFDRQIDTQEGVCTS